MSRKRVSYGVMVVLLSMFALTLAMMPASAQPTADSFGVNDASGQSGTYVQVPVPVSIINVTNGSVLGIGFEISYDKSVINVIDISKGNLVSNWAEPNSKNFAWGTRITIAGSHATDAIQNGTSGSVVLLNFSVIGGAPYKTDMNISGIQLSDPEGKLGTAPARNGTFTVSGGPTPTPTPTPSTGDGGDGGGGNGGYVPTPTPAPTPTEKPPTVEKEVKIISSIEAGKSESVTFEGLDIYNISIEVDKNVSDVAVTVEKVDKLEEITVAPGIVYSYYNMTTTNLTDMNVTATIEFKVNKSWIADKNIEETAIRLNRYDEGWNICPTSKIDEDNTSVYFSGETDGFSLFAVSGEEKVEVVASPSPTGAPTFTPSATPAQTPSSTIPPTIIEQKQTLMLVIGLIVVLVAAIIIYVVFKL